MDRDVLGIVEGKARQGLDGLGLGGREQERLSGRRQVADDRVHAAFEAEIEDAICFIQD